VSLADLNRLAECFFHTGRSKNKNELSAQASVQFFNSLTGEPHYFRQEEYVVLLKAYTQIMKYFNLNIIYFMSARLFKPGSTSFRKKGKRYL